MFPRLLLPTDFFGLGPIISSMVCTWPVVGRVSTWTTSWGDLPVLETGGTTCDRVCVWGAFTLWWLAACVDSTMNNRGGFCWDYSGPAPMRCCWCETRCFGGGWCHMTSQFSHKPGLGIEFVSCDVVKWACRGDLLTLMRWGHLWGVGAKETQSIWKNAIKKRQRLFLTHFGVI